MWCSPHPTIDLAKIDILYEPKLSGGKELVKKQKEAEAAAKALEQTKLVDLRPVPAHYKSYTIGEGKVVFTKAQREPASEGDGVHDGPTETKEVDLAERGEDSKLVYITKDLTRE